MKISLGKAKSFVVLILAAIIGIALQSVGLDIPTDKIEQVVDESLSDVVVTDTPITKQNSYPVLQVIDGDTIIIDREGREETVRLLGIDAQESTGSIRGQECFGDEGKEYAQTLLADTEVTISTDPTQPERDKYDRLLAYVGMTDGRDFGQTMIADGYAYEYTFQGRSYQNQARYQAAEAAAQADGVGLWGVCEH